MDPEDNAERQADKRFAQTVLTFVALGFVAILVAGLSTGLVMFRSQNDAGWVAHTYDVERQVSAIRLDLERMRSARRGFLIKLSSMENNFTAASNDLLERADRVGHLTADNPQQQRNLAELRSRVVSLIDIMSHSMRPDAASSSDAEAIRQGAAQAVEQLAERMLAEENRLLAQRISTQQDSFRRLYLLLALMGVLLAGVAWGSVWVVRRYTRDLAATRNALRVLNLNLEGAVQARTVDLQRANDEIQRFAYIVSHDLRSPLVNVMGFTAELDAATKPLTLLVERASVEAPAILTTEARAAVSDDLPEAIRFIRSSTQKMDRLINAILRLSREGRRPLAAEPLDMDNIAQGVIDALRHRIDELGAVAHVEGALPALRSDRLAIEQILSNLVENAVKYLQPGRAGDIRIRGSRNGDRVLLEVSDNGRGIEQRDHERIFDLFRRSGTQDQPGEGIGLAHVRALAYRLGGTIGVVSEIDRGTTFQLNLPASFAGEKMGEDSA